MKPHLFVAIILIVLGSAVIGYQRFSYKTQEKVLDLGPIHATAERTHTVPIPPIIGWALLLSGAGVFLLGIRQKA